MRQYTCKYTASRIDINADLSKEEWANANSVNLIDVVTGEKPKLKTTAKLLWNEDYLYLAFECEDDYIDVSMSEFNQLLYLGDVVEIFLDDDGDERTYLEVELNPNNAVLYYEIRLTSKKIVFERQDNTIISAVKTEEGKIYYEFAIPTSEFLNTIKSGSKWKCNLFRLDRNKEGFEEFTALCPTGNIREFHLPEFFGAIEFVK